MKLDAVIPNFDGEQHLTYCFDSVKDIASEIVITDCFSTDAVMKSADRQQSWGYEEGPWKGPGPPLLMVADF